MDSWVSLCLTAVMGLCSSGIRFWPSLNALFFVDGNPVISPCHWSDTVCCTCLHFGIAIFTRFYRNMKLFKIQQFSEDTASQNDAVVSELICFIFTTFLLIQTHKSIDRAARVTFFPTDQFLFSPFSLSPPRHDNFCFLKSQWLSIL